MIQEQEILTIDVETKYGLIHIEIEPSSKKDILKYDDEANDEEPQYLLREGCSYLYEIIGGLEDHVYQFAEKSGILFYSLNKKHRNRGTIKTGNYVGTLRLEIIDLDTSERLGLVELEIESEKLDYRSDYQTMLNEIEEYYTDLVLQQGSPVTQKLEIDEETTYNTLYQKFSFLRSIVENPIFVESIHKIISNPIRKWSDTCTERSIVQVKRLSRQNIRQIATSNDRSPLPAGMSTRLPSGLHSLPRHLTVNDKIDTVDVHENQFVKFVLRAFLMFCAELRSKKNCTNPLKLEIDNTTDIINNYLDNQFFYQVSMPSHMNINSPVLQRKEGYREVMQAWLMFDLAAKLSWHGGDDIYDAGKKNVATLYEYWLYFKLLELICDFFDIKKTEKSKLVTTDSDGIDLNIIQGKTLKIQGKHQTENRLLNVAFYYNRSFGRITSREESIHKAGSWTTTMRPDYTLSIWPGEISESEAERQELIVHIHFDAKYKRNKILLEDNDNEDYDSRVEEDSITTEDPLLKEKQQQELGIYKRGDLLKMHAYKDAIRRTSGAYILYPGTVNKELRGFHEIIPGLGAFCIRPGHFAEDSRYLKEFLNDVKQHLLDRTSEREKLSFYHFDIYKEANPFVIKDELPEPVGDNRDFLPDETYVLIGYVKDKEQLEWIRKKGLYNYRAGKQRGSVKIDKKTVSAKYILLMGSHKSICIYKLNEEGPRIMSRSELVSTALDYPKYRNSEGEIDEEKEAERASRLYLVYKLIEAEPVFSKYKWIRSKITALTSRKVGYKDVIKLSELMSLHEKN